MLIPALMIKLDKLHAFFDKSSCHDAIGRKSTRCFCIGTILIKNRLWFVRHISDLRNRRLHSVAEFVLGDPCFNLRVRTFFKLDLM